MNRRGNALRLGVAAAAVWLVGIGTVVDSGASAAPPGTIALSTTTIVPGQEFTITGAGWPAGSRLEASVCGHNGATSGDCAGNFSEFQASPEGTISAHMLGVVPPRPCPCVVLVKGLNFQYTQDIQVTVLTGPVPTPPNEPDLRIQDLRVTATSTWASAMGASAPRTVELRLHNAGPYTETPVVIGRWGHPTQVDHSITMPKVGPLAPGATKSLRATFSLPALSVGAYTVRVTAQVGGFGNGASATAPTTQYPIGLFALLALLLLGVLLLLVTRPRRRRPPPPPPPLPQSPVERRLASSAESEARSAALSGR